MLLKRSRRARGRGRLAAIAVTTAIGIALVLAAALVPAGDLGGSHRAGAARSPAPDGPSAAERYAAVRARGAPVAILKRPVALRAAPDAAARRLARAKERTEWGSPRVLAVLGRRGEWLRVIATELPNGRHGWIPMDATQLVANPWRVRADISRRRVTVLRGGRVMRRFSVSVGKRSTPTPVGRFAVTDKLHMNGHPAYGCCALALSGRQPKIDQGWSGGDRLAVHGTRLVGTIGSAGSFGCLRARDEDARYLIKRVFLGTIVEFRR